MDDGSLCAIDFDININLLIKEIDKINQKTIDNMLLVNVR